MQNTCLNCGKPFEAKRSDAQFCSASCRAKANYQKRCSDKHNETITDVSSKKVELKNELSVEISGELSVDSILQMIKEGEKRLFALKDEVEALLINNNKLELELCELKTQIESVQNKHCYEEAKLQMSDEELYNTFLNEEYLNDVKTKSFKAQISYVSGSLIASPMGDRYQEKILSYVSIVSKNVKDLEMQLEALAKKEVNLDSEISINNEKLKYAKDDKRFFQMRLTRYDNVLLQKL